MSMKTVGVESAAAAAHCTPDPVEVKTCPEVPVEAPAVKEPVIVGPERVNPAIVVTVAPEAIEVDPRVGAEYEDTAAH